MPEVTIQTIVGNIGDVLTEGLSWVGDVANTVVGNPLLMFATVVAFCPIGIAMFKSLFHA